MMDREKSTFVGAMCDLVSASAAAYPLALSSGMGLWCEVAAGAAGYYADVVESVFRGLHNPRQSDKILADLATRCKLHMQRSGDATERAALDFNQRLEASLRQRSEASPSGSQSADGPAVAVLRDAVNTVMQEYWKAQEPGGHVDLPALRRDLERLLEGVRHAEATPCPPETGRGPS
jgi:hypothetical protein